MYNRYIGLLDDLKELNKQVEEKAINDDLFISNNINFFTKSFIITSCAYLESFIKDISMAFIDHCNNVLNSIKIAHNVVKWSVSRKGSLQELKENELKFEDLRINIGRDDLDDFISGNPYKTEKLFHKFGIRLADYSEFSLLKEKIMSIVNKRNKIVHHNDNASDLSFADISTNIEDLKSYVNLLNLAISHAMSTNY